MHLKFLARGTGSAAVAAAYLLALKDAAGKVRAAVDVLRGDPMLVAAIADGLPFKHRYTSGVGAWSGEDAPTRPELERFVDEFEKSAWPGLDRDRYVWAVVLHRDDDGGVHLHIFAARCDLATGLSLNIAAPGWEKTFDPLRDAFNHEHGWSRPDDPSRARSFRPAPHRAYQARAAGRAGEAVKPDPRREIGMHLLELVAAGRVKDRAGVVSALEARGYDVPRQGEHYVTARDRATGERWRLRGALYERDFDRERFLREAPEPSGDRERAAGDDDPAAAAWEAVEKARRRRADYNRAYYGPGRHPGRDGVQAGVAGEVERESVPAAGREAGHDASLAAHLERELGDGAVAAVADAAESVRARRADAGGSRGERSLAAAAFAEAARAASPELSRALSEHEDVADRERAVCATSMGEQWLAEAEQEVLAEEDRPLSVGVRTRAVKTAEGRLETHLSRRASEVAATSSGPALLQEALGKRSYGDAPLSFSARERGLDGVEQRIDEELRTQEEALRAIPPGKRYLSAAEQARAAGAAGPPPLADRESMVRAAMQQVGEELDRREEELLAIISGDALLVEATDALFGDGRTRSLGERWEACERATSGLEAELGREETAVLSEPAGEEFLRDARLEVLSAAGREAATLADRARIVKAAAEAQQEWNAEKTTRVEALGALPGGLNLYHAHLADLDPVWDVNGKITTPRENIDEALAAAESDGARQERLRVVLSDEADAARYREVLDDSPGRFNTATLDRALTAGERARSEREASARRAAALATATEEAQAAAARSNIELLDAHVRVIYETGETHESGLSAVKRTTAALAAAADQQLPTETIIHTWKTNKSAPGGIAAALDAATAVACEERKAAEERAAALAAATEAARAAAARSNVELRDAHVREIYATGETHGSGLSAVERTTAALAAAADQQLPTATIVETWNANMSAPGGIAAALVTKTRVSRLKRLFSAPRAAEAFIVALDGQDPSSRTPTHPTNIDRALDIAEREFGREAEQQFRGASSATGRRAGDDVTEAADTDRHVQQVIDWLRTEVERQQFEALRARTGTDRVNQRNRNAVTAVSEKTPPVPKPARLVPEATWEDAEPLFRAMTDLEKRTEPSRLEQRARHAVTAVSEKTPPVPKPARLVPEATWEDAEPLFRAMTDLEKRTEPSRLEQRARHAVTAVSEKTPPVPKPARLVPEATWEDAEPLFRAMTDLEKRTEPSRLEQRARHAVTAVSEKTPPVPKPARLVPEATWEDVKPQPATTTPDEVSAAPPPPATAPAPEPAAVSVTKAQRVRLAVHVVAAKLPRTQPHSGNSSYRPPAVSDERFDHLAAATHDEFVRRLIAEIQERQANYTDFARRESEKTYLHPAIARKHQENLKAYGKAEAERGFFRRRPPEPTGGEAETVVIKEFEAELLGVIDAVSRDIQQRSPAAVRRELERLEPEQGSTLQPGRSLNRRTKQQDRGARPIR